MKTAIPDHTKELFKLASWYMARWQKRREAIERRCGSNGSRSKYIGVDIETRDASAKHVRQAQTYWKPPPNYKDEKAKARARKDAYARIKSHAALLDKAPIGMVTVITEFDARVFYWDPKPGRMKSFLPGVVTVRCKSERSALQMLSRFLDQVALPYSTIIGHNILGFDIPHLRGRFADKHVMMPGVLHSEARLIGVKYWDSLRRFKNYSVERSQDKYFPLSEFLLRMGMPSHKSTVSGADVPKLLAARRFNEVGLYNLIDVFGVLEGFTGLTDYEPSDILGAMGASR